MRKIGFRKNEKHASYTVGSLVEMTLGGRRAIVTKRKQNWAIGQTLDTQLLAGRLLRGDGLAHLLQ